MDENSRGGSGPAEEGAENKQTHWHASRPFKGPFGSCMRGRSGSGRPSLGRVLSLANNSRRTARGTRGAEQGGGIPRDPSRAPNLTSRSKRSKRSNQYEVTHLVARSCRFALRRCLPCRHSPSRWTSPRSCANTPSEHRWTL